MMSSREQLVAKAKAVRELVGAAQKATDERDRLIVKCRKDGSSLRTIATLADVSHMQVKRIIERDAPEFS